MSNRLLAFIILFVIFGGIFGFIAYFYVYYTGNIKTVSNKSDFNIEFSSNTIKNSFSFNCDKNICLFEDMPPVEYDYIVKKEGYNDISGIFEVETGIDNILQLTFIKKEIIKKIDKEELTGIDKIEEIRKEKILEKYYKSFDLGDKGSFYFKDEGGKLNLYKYGEENKIYTIDNLDKSDIDLLDITNSLNIIISIPEIKIIYNIKTGNTKVVNLKIPLLYAKKQKNNIVFISEKGAFIYDLTMDKIDYFSKYKDFAYYGDESIIGLKEEKNILYIYNIKTKTERLLFELDYNVSQLLNINGEIMIYDDLGEKYILENIKEF